MIQTDTRTRYNIVNVMLCPLTDKGSATNSSVSNNIFQNVSCIERTNRSLNYRTTILARLPSPGEWLKVTIGHPLSIGAILAVRQHWMSGIFAPVNSYGNNNR